MVKLDKEISVVNLSGIEVREVQIIQDKNSKLLKISSVSFSTWFSQVHFCIGLS